MIDETYYVTCAETLDKLPERIIRYRLPDLTIMYCNAAWAAGHHLRPADAVGRTLHDLLSPSEWSGLRSQLARLGPDHTLVSDDTPRAAPNAPGQWVEWVDQYLPGADAAHVLAVGRDVSGRHIAELNLAASEDRFRELADKSSDVVWRFILEPSPHFDYISPSVETTLGYPPQYFLDDFSPYLDILSAEDRAIVEGAFDGHPLPDVIDFHYRHADGSTVIGETQITTISGGLQGVGRDVTELRQLQADLAALAMRDPLTGLANRRLFNELLTADLARAERTDTPLAVAFLDVDNFKDVNDTYGHDAGDIVLCEIARRLLAVVPGADSVARIGGDEFVILYEPDDPSTHNLIARINNALNVPIDISATVAVTCPASIGHADTNTIGLDASALLAAADAAMYDVKRARLHHAMPGTPG